MTDLVGGREVVAMFELRGRDMEIKYYSSGQVLDWWREYTGGISPRAETEQRVKIGPEGYRPAVQSDPVSNGINLDRRYLAWLHVEKFFERNFEWHHCKGHLLRGDPSNVDSVWERWYAANRMQHVSDHVKETGTVHCPEVVSYLLGEALAIYNATAKPGAQRSITAARDAVREGRLYAWHPNGRITTTVNEIERWVKKDSRKNGDSRNSAA